MDYRFNCNFSISCFGVRVETKEKEMIALDEGSQFGVVGYRLQTQESQPSGNSLFPDREEAGGGGEKMRKKKGRDRDSCCSYARPA